jgi:Regulator of chromosome condensation (RCC1) repeat
VRPFDTHALLSTTAATTAVHVIVNTQVSCGLYHTVCLTATGVVVTFGGNEAGQCGHSHNKHTKALPMAMTGLAARAPRGCVQVAAGDMFTLCLTAQVLLLILILLVILFMLTVLLVVIALPLVVVPLAPLLWPLRLLFISLPPPVFHWL